MAYREKVSKTVTRITGRNPALAAWPVNSVFIGYTSANPSTLLGGGTWVQISQGRMLMGQNPSDASCDTVGDTGGARTKLLAGSDTPDHNHYSGTYAVGASGSGHDHPVTFEYLATTATSGSAVRVTDIQDGSGGTGTNATVRTGSGASTHIHDSLNGQSGAVVGFSGQTAVDITNPFLTVYIWRRTA